MQNQEPYLGNDEQQTPSWIRRKTEPLTFWTITWAVCTGVLFASAIEKITDALMFLAAIYLTIDPAVKRLLQGHQ